MKLVILLANIFLYFDLNDAILNMTINQQNCINGVTFYHPCQFSIDIRGTINNLINCTLKFNETNKILNFSNKIIYIKAQADNKCPGFDLTLKTSLKEYRLSTTCGGKIEPINKTFYNFTHSVFVYDSKGLYDNETQILFDMTVENLDKAQCGDQSKIDLRYLGIPCGIIILLGVIIFISRRNKKKVRKQEHSDNASTPLDKKKGRKQENSDNASTPLDKKKERKEENLDNASTPLDKKKRRKQENSDNASTPLDKKKVRKEDNPDNASALLDKKKVRKEENSDNASTLLDKTKERKEENSDNASTLLDKTKERKEENSDNASAPLEGSLINE